MSEINGQSAGAPAAGYGALWRERLEELSPRAGGKLRVGIAWAAFPTSESSPASRLSDWAPLAAARGVVFISLQSGGAAGEAAGAFPLVRLDDAGLTPNSAIIENLDLVISVCPAAANLAETLGIPVWTVNPSAEHPDALFSRVAAELRQWTRLGDVDMCIARADEQILQGDIQAAEQRLWQLLDETPENVAVLNSLGVLLWRAGRSQESLTLLLTALEQNPLHRDTVLNCGDVFQTLGRDDDALALYANYLQEFPDDQETRQIRDCVAETERATGV